jgi:hypothetical protein
MICLIFQKWLEKHLQNKYKNHRRSNNYKVCTAVPRCFPNILNVENVNLSEDKIGRPPLWSYETDLDSDFSHQSPTYAVSSVHFKHTLISYVHWT